VRWTRWNISLMVLVVGIMGIATFRSSHLGNSLPKDYVLPHDNFDQTTMGEIWAHLNQFNVAQTPEDHEVYMVTGGLGVANPRLMGWDSGGNMQFGSNSGTTYEIRETANDPATWKYAIPHVIDQDAKNATFTYQPTHWTKQYTDTHQVYYQLDDPNQSPQYYFQKGNTFVLVITFPNDAFPQGLMNHMVPLGNPIKK
jgi:hypothetical protein